MVRAMVGGLLVVVFALVGAGCGGDASTDSTFSCSGGGTTMNCLSTTQYCEQASDGTTVTRAMCVTVPAGCGDNPCSGCLASGTNGIIGCSSIRIGTNRSTTVTVRR